MRVVCLFVRFAVVVLSVIQETPWVLSSSPFIETHANDSKITADVKTITRKVLEQGDLMSQ